MARSDSVLTKAYDEVSAANSDACIAYKSSLPVRRMSAPSRQARFPDMQELHDEMLASLEAGAALTRSNVASRGRSPTATMWCSRWGQLPA